MANTNTISLVIPCDAADAIFLEYSLPSVNCQTLLPCEIIVALSDISHEGARGFERHLRTLLHDDVELVVLDTPEKLCAGSNRQRGAEIAKGNIVSWFDSDDIQSRDRLLLIEHAFRDPTIQIVYHRFMKHGRNEYPPVDEKAWFAGAILMYHRGWVSVRTGVVQKIRWGNEPRAQDFGYLEKVKKHFSRSEIALLPEILGFYINTGFQDQSQLVIQKLKLMKKYLYEFPFRNVSDAASEIRKREKGSGQLKSCR